MYNVTTPKDITPAVLEFCESIVPGQKPAFVNVIPENYAIASYCHPNVWVKIKKSGGDILSGWAIWLSEGISIEAEYHSIWQSVDGQLIDITPKKDGENLILFLPEPGKIYKGEKPPVNKYKVLVADPVVRDEIESNYQMTILVSDIQYSAWDTSQSIRTRKRIINQIEQVALRTFKKRHQRKEKRKAKWKARQRR